MSLPHMILGLLSHQALSGYDLNKLFDSSVQHFWNTDQSQIYRALYKLAEQGWVETEVIQQDGSPDKKNYSLTDAGRGELMHWVSKPHPFAPVREAWLGQIFFGDAIDRKRLIEIMEIYRNQAQETAGELGALRDYLQQMCEAGDEAIFGGLTQLLTLDFGVEYNHFFADWFDKAIARLREATQNQDGEN
jgi:DNA-binding PadR family transcriptional regulator